MPRPLLPLLILRGGPGGQPLRNQHTSGTIWAGVRMHPTTDRRSGNFSIGCKPLVSKGFKLCEGGFPVVGEGDGDTEKLLAGVGIGWVLDKAVCLNPSYSENPPNPLKMIKYRGAAIRLVGRRAVKSFIPSAIDTRTP